MHEPTEHERQVAAMTLGRHRTSVHIQGHLKRLGVAHFIVGAAKVVDDKTTTFSVLHDEMELGHAKIESLSRLIADRVRITLSSEMFLLKPRIYRSSESAAKTIATLFRPPSRDERIRFRLRQELEPLHRRALEMDKAEPSILGTPERARAALDYLSSGIVTPLVGDILAEHRAFKAERRAIEDAAAAILDRIERETP